MVLELFGAWGGPGVRSCGPVWRGVDGPVTICLPMAVHTLGNVVRGPEVPTGGCGGLGVEMSGVGGSVVLESAGGVSASGLPRPLHSPRFTPLPRLPSYT